MKSSRACLVRIDAGIRLVILLSPRWSPAAAGRVALCLLGREFPRPFFQQLLDITTTDDRISMYFADDHWASSVYDRSATRAGNWRVVEADSIIRVVDNFQPSILLVDVEGYETELLAVTRLDGVRGILIDMHPYIVGTEPIVALRAHLGALGFSLRDSCGGSEVYVRND